MSAAEVMESVFTEGNRTLVMDRIMRGEGFGHNWFRCADGTKLSVVAGGGTYCSPRHGDGPFDEVEVWWPGADEPTGWVPVADVRAFVAERGGVVGVASSEDEA